jgi:DNA/RNA endonuclease YhcR with UshA esterase domain
VHFSVPVTDFAGKSSYDQNMICSSTAKVLLALSLPWANLLVASDCVPISEASQHVGETRCVTGKVLRIKVGASGVHFLDFCEDQMACPFTVVVFPHGLRDVGDVRRLAGRMIEIKGPVKLYDGRPEIILNRISQISGGAAMIPPLPKNYDVENRGHYSAGHFYSKKLKKTKATPNPTATYDVEDSEPP